MTLMEFSMFPVDKGVHLGEYVARCLEIVDDSGLDYRINPMGTVVEGDWEDLVKLLTDCFRALEADCERVSVLAKFDYRRGVTGAIESKVRSVEDKSGRRLKR